MFGGQHFHLSSLSSSRGSSARVRSIATATARARAPPARGPCSRLGPAPTRRQLLSPPAAFNTQTIEDGFGNKIVLPNGLVDLYVVLGVDDDAPPSEIKRAYRNLARECHPDFLGEAGHDICILLNEAYSTLMDSELRYAFDVKLEQALIDVDDDFNGKLMSKWMPTLAPHMAKHEDPYERRAVFVDEFSCIGCKNCVWCASAMFRIEPEHGRSRVFAQWLDTEEKIQESIDTCPVECIHWVDKDDLPALEYVTQIRITERTNVGVMMANPNRRLDVFGATADFLRERRRLEEKLAEDSTKRAYSPEQEKTRRAAAEALRKKNGGWAFSSFEDLLQGAFASANSYVDGPTSTEELKKVGKRKRTMRWDELIKMQEESGSSIPLDRSLVPVSMMVRNDE